MLSPVDEIKSRLDILEIIQGYLKLQKAGSNWKGLCPFHSEKTASFMVSPSKQMWHCFGCNQGGDIFTFVAKMEGLEFADALRLLAAKAGVKLGRQNPQIQSQRKKLFEIAELATRFFQRQLASTTGQAVVSYLQERGVNLKTIEYFRIGFAPDNWQGLHDFLRDEGYGDADVEKTGLILRGEDRPDYHDRFRARIMFPIADSQGQVVGFSGRLFDGFDRLTTSGSTSLTTSKFKAKTVPADAGKYINTPNTLIYDKSRVLYGLDKAKGNIQREDSCVVVEGNLDVVLSHQAGVKNTVAPCGTALSPDHFKVLKRFGSKLLLAFDADSAGEAALKRSVRVALSSGFNVTAVPMPGGKDAAEVVKNDPKLWAAAVLKPVPYLEFILQSALAKFSASTLEGKKNIAAAVLPFIKSTYSPLERQHWLGELAVKTGVHENVLEEEMKLLKLTGESPVLEESRPGPVLNESLPQLEEYLVALLIKYPELKRYLGEEELVLLSHPSLALAARTLLADSTVQAGLISSSVMLVSDFLDEFVTDAEAEFLKILNYLKVRHIKEKLKVIQLDIKKAEAGGDQTNLQVLLAEFRNLSKKLSDYNGQEKTQKI